MKSFKQGYKHRVLNLFTMMNYLVSKDSLDEQEKEELRQYLELAGLFVEHEDVILGEPPSFFLQEIDLSELLNIFHEFFSEKIQKNQVHIRLPEQTLLLKQDQYYLSQSLKLLFDQLLDSAHELILETDPKKQQLIIHHDTTTIFPSPKPPLREILLKKGLPHEEIPLKLAQEILLAMGVVIEEKEGEIRLGFRV